MTKSTPPPELSELKSNSANSQKPHSNPTKTNKKVVHKPAANTAAPAAATTPATAPVATKSKATAKTPAPAAAQSAVPTPAKPRSRGQRILGAAIATTGLCIWTVSVFMAVQIGLGAAVRLLAQVDSLAAFGESLNPQLATAIISALIYLLTILLVVLPPWLVVRKATNRPTRQLLGFADALPRWRDVTLAPLAYLACLFTTVGLTLVLQQLIPGLTVDQEQSLPFDPEGIFTRTDMALVYLVLVVLAPVGEEILFRGYLFGKLRRFLPATATVIVTAVVFGALHVIGFDENNNFQPQFTAMIAITVLGVGLGMLREYTGNIWASLFTHMIQNSVAFFVLFILGNMIQ